MVLQRLSPLVSQPLDLILEEAFAGPYLATNKSHHLRLSKLNERGVFQPCNSFGSMRRWDGNNQRPVDALTVGEIGWRKAFPGICPSRNGGGGTAAQANGGGSPKQRNGDVKLHWKCVSFGMAAFHPLQTEATGRQT